MKITKIEKKKRLYLIEIDDKEKMYVTEDTIVKYLLSKGMVLTQEELTEIQEFAQYSYAKNLALYHISFKQRTAKEVREYLTKHEINETTIIKIINDLKKDHWIDESKMVENVVYANASSGDKGPSVLKSKLMQRGISSTIIDPILENEDFSDLALKVGKKIVRKYEHRLAYQATIDKVKQGLMTKGFDYATISKILPQLEIEQDEENEMDLIYQELEKVYRKYSRKYEGYELKQRVFQALARKRFDFDDINRALRDYF